MIIKKNLDDTIPHVYLFIYVFEFIYLHIPCIYQLSVQNMSLFIPLKLYQLTGGIHGAALQRPGTQQDPVSSRGLVVMVGD